MNVSSSTQGGESVSHKIPFILLNHYNSGAVIDRLLTSHELIADETLLRSKEALETALANYVQLRSEIVREKGLPRPAQYLFGDLTKGGRPAAPEELGSLSGLQPGNVPMGLSQCGRCGGWKGQCLDPDPSFKGWVMPVHCLCDNHNRCARCGEQLYQYRLNANYFEVEDGQIWHVPGFCGLNHRCSN
jgi:hypothetical protein